MKPLFAAIRIYGFAGRLDLVELAARKLIQIDPVGDEGNSWLFFVLLDQLATIYDGPEVQAMLRQINLDNESIRRLKI